MKTTTFCHTLWGWLAFLFLPLLAASCSESMDEPIEDNDSEYEIEITPAQVLHSILVGNFYTPGESPEPEKGIVLDESRPSERSVACESFELALEDFERYLTDNEEHQQFISRDANTISVELGNLGSVKFAPATGNGIVARIDINLKGAPEYTVLYRHEASFGDNFDSSQDLSTVFSPGDLLEFKCPKLRREDRVLLLAEEPSKHFLQCLRMITGVVITVKKNYMKVLTDHAHTYKLSDWWKRDFLMYEGLVSEYDLLDLYYSWKNYKAAFIDTFENVCGDSLYIYHNYSDDYNICRYIYQIMDESVKNPHYVCECGTGVNLRTHLYYWDLLTWNSKANTIKVSNLRAPNGMKFETVDYATNERIKHIASYYLTMVEISNSELTDLCVRRIYPKY